jgi:hypothetical protein
MAQTIYATFPDPSLAEKAAGALLDHGARNEDISLISRDDNNATTRAADAGRTDYTAHSAPLDERRSAAAFDTGAAPRGVTVDDPYSVPVRHPDEMSSSGYRDAGMTGRSEPVVTNVHRDEYDASFDRDRDSNTTYVNHATGQGDRAEMAAKQGISTTTPGDAAAGAAKGAGWGLGLGVLAGLASIFVPGFGLVVGGGALATAIAGMAATTAAGAIAGGVYGYLRDQGMPEHIATTYNWAYEHGHAILSVTVPSGDLGEMTAREILEKYGAENINTYGGLDAMAA